MNIRHFVAALTLALPTIALADDAPQAKPVETPKVKKICRPQPAPTGSNRPSVRICKTADEWREIDRNNADYEGGTNGAPAKTKD